MKPDRLNLSDEFRDNGLSFQIPRSCRKFLNAPEKKYPESMQIRVGDHFDGKKTDIPFHNDQLVKKISHIASVMNSENDKSNDIYLYIPAHANASDRTLIVYAMHEETAYIAVKQLREIFEAYRRSDLDSVNSLDLAINETEKQAFEKWAAGRPFEPKIEQGIISGRVEFRKKGSIKMLDGEELSIHSCVDLESLPDNQLTSFQKLKSYLRQELHLTILPVHSGSLDVEGPVENVRIGCFIGCKAAGKILKDEAVTETWLRSQHQEAARIISKSNVENILGATRLAPPQRRQNFG